MPLTVPWDLKQFQLTLTLGATDVPVTGFRAQYELNALPQATVQIPTGRELRTLLPAGVPSQFDSGQAIPALVTAQVAYAASVGGTPDFGLPAGPFTLFRGYLDWVGYRRSGDQSALQLNLRHWLADLDFSSIYSRYSHPTNPVEYSTAAVLPAETAGHTAAIYGQAFDYGQNLSAANVQSDLWTRTLQPYFLALCKVDGLRITEQNVAPRSADNTEASAALQRLTAYPALGLAPLVDIDVAKLMANQLLDMVRNNAFLASHTFWDVLVGSIAPEYGFAIVPRILDALVVPAIPTLRTPYTTITADEYYMAEIEGSIARPLQAVGLICGLQEGVGVAMPPDPNVSIVGGWYTNPDMKKGTILVTRGPRWSERLPGLTLADRDAAAGRGGQPVGVAAAPAAAGPPNPAVRARVAAGVAATNSVLDALAQARYANELDRTRQGFIGGPFRLDIAPGSIVAIEPDGLQWLNAGQTTTFYGAVARVAIVLDAEARSAGTSFHLSHIRTAAENRSAGRTVAAHPFFAKTYAGAGMLSSPKPAGR